MTHDNPFLQALLAEPDDDTLRLAMADWLDEHDQPARAEFIRVQIELARSVADRNRRWKLELRQRDLLMAHDTEWVSPLAQVLGCKPGQWGGWVFRRGFVEYFRLPVHALVTHGARLARLTPMRELNLDCDSCGSWSLKDLWQQPWLRAVTHLYGLELHPSTAEDMLNCPYLTGLRVLESRWKDLSKPLRQRFVKRFGHALPPSDERT